MGWIMSPPKFMLKLSNPSLCARCTVQFSRSVMSNSLQPHGLQQARLPCPSPTPGACSNSCPSGQWWNPTCSSCHPLLLLPLIFPCIKVFSSESALCVRWSKFWSFRFSCSISAAQWGQTKQSTWVSGAKKDLLTEHQGEWAAHD